MKARQPKSLQLQVRLPAMFAPGFFEGRQSAPGVDHCVVSTSPALGRRYRNRELLAFGYDLTELVILQLLFYVGEHMEDLAFYNCSDWALVIVI